MIIRAAGPEDAPAVAECIAALLRELSGMPDYPVAPGAEAVCRRIAEGETAGAVFIAEAEAGGEPIGCMTLSVQEAVRYGGPYVEIQELWVLPEQRSHKIGAALVEAAERFCRERGVSALEVGLPVPQLFVDYGRTETFYRGHGFNLIDPRLRKLIAAP